MMGILDSKKKNTDQLLIEELQAEKLRLNDQLAQERNNFAQENQALAAEIQSLNERLVRARIDSNGSKSEVVTLAETIESLKEELYKTRLETSAKNQNLIEENQRRIGYQSALLGAQNNLLLEIKQLEEALGTQKEELFRQKKTIQENKKQNENIEKEKLTLQKELEKAYSDLGSTQYFKEKLEVEIEAAKSKEQSYLLEIESLKTKDQDFVKDSEEFQQTLVRIQDLKNDNDLLLLQIYQQQEELDELHFSLEEGRKQIKLLTNKWNRLMIRQPNYVDYGGLEMLTTDSTVDVPYVSWRVSDSSSEGVIIPEFEFRTTLQVDGVGIALIEDGKVNLARQLIPSLIRKSESHANVFRKMGESQWRKTQAAINSLELLSNNKWSGVTYAEGYDPGFWRSSLLSLINDSKQLPLIFRYDKVKLKRELQNPDYEHLWLEFDRVGLGSYHQPKLEVRLGASLIKPGAFSRFPKIEFPLVDGKVKPFESWYPESQDDYGSKLEFRFSLDSRSFDSAVWSSLSNLDRIVVSSIILGLGKALVELKEKPTSLSRRWEEWIGFAADTAKIVQDFFARQTSEVQAPPQMPKIGPTPEKKLVAPKVEKQDELSVQQTPTSPSLDISPALKTPPAKKGQLQKEIVISTKKRSSKKTG